MAVYEFILFLFVTINMTVFDRKTLQHKSSYVINKYAKAVPCFVICLFTGGCVLCLFS